MYMYIYGTMYCIVCESMRPLYIRIRYIHLFKYNRETKTCEMSSYPDCELYTAGTEYDDNGD